MQHYLTQADNNTTIAVHPGDTVTIELEETPTTGYMWDAGTGYSVAQLQSSNYEVGSPAIGGGGKRKISFTIVGKGNEPITLKNRQQWTGDVAATVSIHLNAQ